MAWTNRSCLSAAQHGRLDVLEYLVRQGCNLLGGGLSVHKAAASGGHAHVMRYLSTNRIDNLKWNAQEALERSLIKVWDNVDEKAAFLTDALEICKGARIPVRGLGSLLLLEPDYFDTILLANFNRVVGHPTPVLPADFWDPYILIKAAVGAGSLRMVNWVIDRGFPCDDDYILSDALKNGRMDLLEALIDDGREWTDASCREGFVTGARENRVADLLACTKQAGGGTVFGNGRGTDLCESAAVGGAAEALGFVLEKTAGRKDECICVHAILTGRLEVIRVAVDGGAPLSVQCLLAAVVEGRAQIVEYLLDMGCPIDIDRFLLAKKASRPRRADVCEVLVSRKVVSVLEVAVARGSLDAIERLLCACDDVPLGVLRGAATMTDPAPLKLLYTKVDGERWMEEYDGLLSRASWRGDVETSAWIEGTRAWQYCSSRSHRPARTAKDLSDESAQTAKRLCTGATQRAGNDSPMSLRSRRGAWACG